MADGSIIPTYALCRFASQHVKVALGGDGGDEMLAGYSTLQAHKLAQLYGKVPRAIRRGLIEPAVDRLPVSMNNLSFDFKARRFVRDAVRPVEVRHHLWLGNFRQDEFARLLTPQVQADLAGVDPLAPVSRYAAECKARDELNRVLYLDMKLYMESDILVKVDRASMANSLEVRVPLLNRVFVDYVSALPIDYKLKGFTRKYLLREALRGKLPDEILDRQKHGFGMPISKWLRSDLKQLAQDQLSEARLRRDGLFEPSYVQGLLANHFAGRQDNRKPLWTLLVFQLWYDRYVSAITTSEAGKRPRHVTVEVA
jgi:asparagine synthase (glutamine-hydrolysing)